MRAIRSSSNNGGHSLSGDHEGSLVLSRSFIQATLHLGSGMGTSVVLESPALANAHCGKGQY